MAEYLIDERDMKFNMKECPGLKMVAELEAFQDCDEDSFDLIFEQSKAFCQKVLAPLLMSSDREGCQFKDGKVQVPAGVAEAWEQYKELGLIGMNSSADYGGAELPHLFSTPVTEMECGSFVSFSMLPLLTRGAARLIQNFAEPALKERYLENMFTGHWTGTMCLTESGAGSDVGAGTTVAVPDGDAYRITGSKIFISWGEHGLSENIIHLVLARIKGSPGGSKGLSLFVVPKFNIDDQGGILDGNKVACGNIEHKMGIKASPTCVINFDGSKGFIVGDPNKGMRYMFQMMNEARLEVGIQGQAQAAAAYMAALGYAKERIQGSVQEGDTTKQAKIIEHPDVRRMLLRMRALVEGCRSLIYHLVTYMDLVHHPTESKKYGALVELMTPICKSYGSDQGFRVTELAVQTFGGYGFCQEYPVEQYMRDSKISSIYEGTNGIQAMDLVFRKILRNRGESLGFWHGDVKALCNRCRDTTLADLNPPLLESLEMVGKAVQAFGEWMKAGKLDDIRYHATNFQEQMGHIMVGYFLLKQSLEANRALAHNPTPADETYYRQKIVTTRYFFAEILPMASAGLEIICNNQISELDMAFV